MIGHVPSPSVRVSLAESTLALVMAAHQSDDETINAIIARCAAGAASALPRYAPANLDGSPAPSPSPSGADIPQATATLPASCAGKHQVLLLGERICAPTLGKLFAAVVDAVYDLDPAAIERLSEMRGRTRRFVARYKGDVNDGRLDLPHLKTRSSWWVSGNVSRADVRRALKSLCHACGLDAQHDIRLI
jgi:hypothetical protein